MSLSNKFFLIGNLTRDPSSRIVGNDNKTVVTLDIAVNEKINGKEETTFFRVTAWGDIGANAHQYLSTGSTIAVEGYMKNNPRDLGDGKKSFEFNFIAEEIKYLSPKKS